MKDLVYVLLADDYVGLPADESVFHYCELFDLEAAVVAVKCETCGATSLLWGDCPEQTEVHEREMGPERYFAASCWGRCDNCDKEMSADLQFSVYAWSWVFIDADCENCEMTSLSGLRLIVKELTKSWAKLRSGEDESADEREIEEWAQKPSGCAVFVEGEDDRSVISEFLRRQVEGELFDLSIHLFRGLGGGGRELAVNSAKYVSEIAKRVGSPIPYIIVLDGDASNWAKTQKEIDASRVFVLSRKEIDSFLLESRAIAEVCGVTDEKVRDLLGAKRQGKEELESILRKFNVRPTPEVKQLIARHLTVVPDDFVRLMREIERIREE